MPRRIDGLVGIDLDSGRARWNLEAYAAHSCFDVERTTSAVCAVQGISPGWPNSAAYWAFHVVDLTSESVTGRTTLPGNIQAIGEIDGRVISFIALSGGDVTEIAAGSLADPQAKWVTRVPRRADKPVRAGTLDHIGAEPVPLTADEEELETATGCTIRSSGDDEVIGSWATVREGESPAVNITTGTPVKTPTAVRIEITPGGAVIASAVCPPGCDHSTQDDDLDWAYQRLDDVAPPPRDRRRAHHGLPAQRSAQVSRW